MDVAFLTEVRFPRFYEDDVPAVRALEARGVRVHPVRWDLTTPGALSSYDAVVVRSVWDWFLRKPEFLRFLEGLGAVRGPVLNPPALLRAYSDKRYLLELGARGLAVVPTEVLAPEALGALPEVLARRGWARAVLKPAITAGAVGAQRVARGQAAGLEVPALGPGEAWLVQPYLEEVEAGEWSFLFFGGAFSHAVRKVPVAGEWRVQSLYGGVASAVEAPGELVAQAAALLAAAAPDTLYARVDGVVLGGRLTLMELEVVEPELFFRLSPTAPEAFAGALLERLG